MYGKYTDGFEPTCINRGNWMNMELTTTMACVSKVNISYPDFKFNYMYTKTVHYPTV